MSKASIDSSNSLKNGQPNDRTNDCVEMLDCWARVSKSVSVTCSASWTARWAEGTKPLRCTSFARPSNVPIDAMKMYQDLFGVLVMVQEVVELSNSEGVIAET